MAGQLEHRLAPLDLLRVAAMHPAERIAAPQVHLPDPLRMADGIGDGDRRALADAQQVEAVEAGGVDHAFEIVDEGFEIQGACQSERPLPRSS